MTVFAWEAKLNDFDPAVRRAALLEAKQAIADGAVECAPVTGCLETKCQKWKELWSSTTQFSREKLRLRGGE